MKKRMSRIIAIMLVLLMVVCNQSYSSMASDTDNSISGETKTLSGENEAGYTEVATDSDAGIEVNNAVIAEEDKNTDTEEDTEANDSSDMEINSDMKDIAAESEVSEEGEDEKTYPAFVKSESVDGVRVTVTAACGVFPAGAALSVEKASDTEKQQIEQAVDAVREDCVSVAQTYTFDIKVLDENGNEIQPADGQTVNVSFDMDEVSNQNLSTDIYHIPEENGNLVAEELSTSENGNTVTAVSDGFSYYTVEFTYDEKQYVMEGDSTVALTDILSYVGITKADGSAATDSDITSVSVSDESLFSASNESGEWIVTAHQAFTSNEWMKVTVDGVEYEIVVTDAEYSSGVKFNNLSVGDILKNGSAILSDNSVSNHKVAAIWVDGVQKKTIAGSQAYNDKGKALETSYYVSGGNYKVTKLDDTISTSYHIYIVKVAANDASYSAATSFTYDGNQKTAVTGNNVTITGDNQKTDVGFYTAYVAGLFRRR